MHSLLVAERKKSVRSWRLEVTKGEFFFGAKKSLFLMHASISLPV